VEKVENQLKTMFENIVEVPISALESILEQGVESKRTRRLWLLCFIVSTGALVTLITMFFASSVSREYIMAFISLTSGLVAAFLIAWINEVSKEKETKSRRHRFRKYYVEKFKQSKTEKQKADILKEIEERNIFEDEPIFTTEELSNISNS